MNPDSMPALPFPHAHRPSRRTRRRSLVELARRSAQRVPAPRLRTVARDRAQPGPDAAADRRRTSSTPQRPIRSSSRSTIARIAALDAARAAHNTWWTNTMPHAQRPDRSPTSPRSSRCTSRCRFTPAASACSPAITARKPSDLGVPLIGVGFMYPQGYFHQHVSAEGWQEESYERLNWADAPIEPAMTPDGKPCITAVPLGDRSVLVAVWRVRLGRVTLYLLDTDPRGERAVGSRAVGAAVRRRSRNAHPAGDHPRHRRRPRAEGARRRAGACST